MSDCQYCVHDHEPAEGYPGKCPFYGTAQAWKRGRPRPLSTEYQHAFTMREIERRIAEENRPKQQDAERRQRQDLLQEAKARAARREMTAWIREAEQAALAEVHVSIAAQQQARRLDRRFGPQADPPRREPMPVKVRGEDQSQERRSDKDRGARLAIEFKGLRDDGEEP
jgi:hypothetical protein